MQLIKASSIPAMPVCAVPNNTFLLPLHDQAMLPAGQRQQQGGRAAGGPARLAHCSGRRARSAASRRRAPPCRRLRSRLRGRKGCCDCSWPPPGQGALGLSIDHQLPGPKASIMRKQLQARPRRWQQRHRAPAPARAAHHIDPRPRFPWACTCGPASAAGSAAAARRRQRVQLVDEDDRGRSRPRRGKHALRIRASHCLCRAPAKEGVRPWRSLASLPPERARRKRLQPA